MDVAVRVVKDFDARADTEEAPLRVQRMVLHAAESVWRDDPAGLTRGLLPAPVQQDPLRLLGQIHIPPPVQSIVAPRPQPEP